MSEEESKSYSSVDDMVTDFKVSREKEKKKIIQLNTFSTMMFIYLFIGFVIVGLILKTTIER
jgi:hypothetical protein